MWPSHRLASIGLDSRQRKSRARRRDRQGTRPIVTLLEERTLLSQPGTWATIAPLPTARVYLGAATGSNGTIYAVGGLEYGDIHTNEVDAYSPVTKTWTQVAPLPWAGETSASLTMASSTPLVATRLLTAMPVLLLLTIHKPILGRLWLLYRLLVAISLLRLAAMAPSTSWAVVVPMV